MFIAINRIRVTRGEGGELEERFAQSRGIEALPGFIEFRLLKKTWGHGDDEADEYLSMTQWASKKDFVAWTKSDAFKKAHSGPRAKGVIGAQPAGYEVVVERGVEG